MADKSKLFTVGAECAVSFNGTGMVAKEETLSCEYSWYDPAEGMIADREAKKNRRLHLKQDVKGDVTFVPAYLEAIQILAAIFNTSGTSTESTSFSGYTARVLPTDPYNTLVTMEVDRNHAASKTFYYGSCWVEKVSLKCSENNPAELTISCLGQSEIEGTNTIPAATTTNPCPAIMDDCTLYLGADQYFPTGFEVTVDLQMEDRFMNSLTRVHAQPKILSVTGKIDLDLNTDNWVVFQKNATDNDSYAVGLKFYDGTRGFGFYLPVCCVTSKTPTITGADVVKGSLEFRAFRNGTVDPTVVCFTKSS